MAIINILDKHTAELIAAGEVVEKPASVVKELVENAIDAHAKNISVEIEKGGVKRIIVQDDGSGIDSEYVKIAFIRHATSKIAQKEDLDHIQSLGFRGEALASIASVSHLTLLTKTPQQDFGIELKLQGGEEVSFGVKPFVDGSRFIINDLFFNTPARMKFLKKDATEAGYIQEILTNLALSNPQISFTFKKEGKEVFSTIGDGDLKNTIACLFGTTFANQVCTVNAQEDKYTVHGFTTLPHFSRQSRNMQFVFINGRYVKNKTIMAAVENAYKGTVMVGKFPAYVLNILMPYDCVDVNVHPAKTEVRFANDSEVFSAVYRAIKNALSENQDFKKITLSSPKENKFYIDTEAIKQQELSSVQLKETQEQKDKVASSYPKTTLKIAPTETKQGFKTVTAAEFKEQYHPNKVDIVSSDSGFTPYFTKSSETKSAYESSNLFIPFEDPMVNSPKDVAGKTSAVCEVEKNKLENDTKPRVTEELSVLTEASSSVSSQESQKEEPIINSEEFIIIGECFKAYILIEFQNQLLLIDKHAAHERLLYEKLKKSQKCEPQLLLVPVGVNLSADEKQALMNELEFLTNQGFIIEDLGFSGVMVRGVPLNITTQDPQTLVEEIAYNLVHETYEALSEKQDWILHSIACRSAIKAGDKTFMPEIIALVQDIQTQKIPLYCPHGRPILISLTKKEIEKQFGRS